MNEKIVLISVYVKDINKAIQQFKRKTKELGHLELLKSKKEYESRSERRHKDKTNRKRQNRKSRQG